MAYAVRRQETDDFRLGCGRYNNGYGIMAWRNGKRGCKAYATKDESTDDFKRIWSSSYKVFPTIREAVRWTGNDRAEIWLRNVTYFYDRINLYQNGETR